MYVAQQEASDELSMETVVWITLPNGPRRLIEPKITLNQRTLLL